jgi:hypothetical protein
VKGSSALVGAPFFISFTSSAAGWLLKMLLRLIVARGLELSFEGVEILGVTVSLGAGVAGADICATAGVCSGSVMPTEKEASVSA